MHVFVAHAAHTARDHYRLVVASHRLISRRLILKSAEIAANCWPAEFIVKAGSANGAFQHDVQRRHQMFRFSRCQFPRLGQLWQIQMRRRKTGQPRLGFRATPHSPLISNFTAGTGRCASKWRNSGWVIVGFNLHQYVRGFWHKLVTLGASIDQ